MDDHHVVDGLCDLREHVARDEDRPALGRERAEEVAKPPDALRIEPIRRLVEHEHLGIAEQRGGEAEPLPHPERVALHAAPARLRQLDELEHLVDPRPRDAAGEGEDTEVVAPGSTRVRVEGLEERADLSHRGGRARGRDDRGRSSFRRSDGRARESTRIVVDLPAPFGPRKPVTVPARP